MFATCFDATSTRRILPPAQKTIDFVSGVQRHRRVDAVDRPGLLHVAIEPVVERRLAPDSRSLTKSVDL